MTLKEVVLALKRSILTSVKNVLVVAHGKRSAKADRTTSFFSSFSLSPCNIYTASPKRRTSVITSKAVTTCHRWN